QSGAVAWQFEPKGIVVVDAEPDDAEEFALVAIDAGADDFETFDSTLQIFSPVERLEAIRQTLTDTEASIVSSELSMIPNSTITLDTKAATQTLRLLDQLEELDDVQKVYSNADFPDEVLEQYRDE
ncbi:MAG: YebC/PmpR family DNA-binding transcriptional regulator, partial [Chloroflexi bacterium]|nr:YebC/PmpR family DNA-binding transcriptional regulator [Chloroflexota bacterium]